MPSRTVQDLLRWGDRPSVRRVWGWIAVGLGVALLVATMVYKQFHGPRDETTLAQLTLARSLAEGRGFASPILYPQAAAWLAGASQSAERVAGLDSPRALPDVYQPPGYPLVASAALRVVPSSLRERLFGAALPPPHGYPADYYLLAWGIGGLLAVSGAVAWAGRKWFEARVGVWAAWGVLACAPAWAGVLGLTGAPVAMGLGLAVFIFSLQAWNAAGARRLAWAAGAGVAAGAWGLVDYPWLVAGPVVALWLGLTGGAGRRMPAVSAVLLGWVVVAGPWVARNESLTGMPLGLAGQNLFLRVGDVTAEPSVWRSTALAELPKVDWNKANHKLLLHAKAWATGDFWATGGLLAAGLLLGFVFRYQDPGKRAARGLTWALLVVGFWAEGWLDAGESARPVVLTLWPVLALWGASFLHLLAESRVEWRQRWGWVTAGFVVVQALPLSHDLAEPAGIRFSYPPYYPALLQTLARETERRGNWSWMSDVPAGSAWYSGSRVWAMPASGEDFRRVAAQTPVLALLLTPRTLDKPFYTELARRDEETRQPFWQWADVYAGLATGRFPASFPLQRVERYAPNMVVLIDAKAGAR